MTNGNRFDGLYDNLVDELDTKVDTNAEITSNTEILHENKNTRNSIQVNLVEDAEHEIKVQSNFTLYPSSKKKLRYLTKVFNKRSDSAFLDEIIDELYKQAKEAGK